MDRIEELLREMNKDIPDRCDICMAITDEVTYKVNKGICEDCINELAMLQKELDDE